MSAPDRLPVRWDVSPETDEALSYFVAALNEAGHPAETADAALLSALTIATALVEVQGQLGELLRAMRGEKPGGSSCWPS